MIIAGSRMAKITRFQSGTIARLPISEEQGMRLWALLDRLRQDKGWSAPATPVSVDRMQ